MMSAVRVAPAASAAAAAVGAARRCLASCSATADVVIVRTSAPKPKLPNHELTFGRSFSDHMLEIDWTKAGGWQTPRISPYHQLALDPAASSLHYALQVFEGMKAYIDAEDRIRLFRPEKNMQRMADSAARLFLPRPDPHFLDCIKQLLRVDKDWIPRGDGYSLYIRPTLISTHPFLGVGPSESAKFYTILSPVGPYYPQGFSAVSLYADSVNVRAWPGGAGNAKIGGNYAPTIKAQVEAAQKGYSQVLWLFGEEFYVTEVGTMNMFFYLKKESGDGNELITAPLDGTILPGVTRDSVLDLARQWGEFDVIERRYTLPQIIEALDQGRVIEAFGSGTAAIVSPVKSFEFNGKNYQIPLDPDNAEAQAGPLAARLASTIMDIQYGRVEHPWSVAVDE